MRKADLHIHTVASHDSNLEAEEVFRKARDAGLSAIAFTDHEGTTCNEEGRRLSVRYGIDFLPGIEMSSSRQGQLAHVLGYFPNGAAPSLRQFVIDAVWRGTRLNALAIMDGLRGLGIEITSEEYDEEAETLGYCGSPLFQLLLKNGHVADLEDYQSKMTALDSEPIEVLYPLVPQTVQAIHEAGGMAVLAHPGAVPEFYLFHEADIVTLATERLDGIEALHPKHSEAQIAYYTEIADRLGLLRTGGSDSHGRGTAENRRYVGGMTCDWDSIRENLEKLR